MINLKALLTPFPRSAAIFLDTPKDLLMHILGQPTMVALGVPADAVTGRGRSWLPSPVQTGKHAEASTLFASIPVPAAGSEREALYYGCKACFYASAGDKEQLSQAITRSLELADDHFVKFVRRDVVFDRYRQEAWFVELVGVTVRP